jgi:hypothetical protein
MGLALAFTGRGVGKTKVIKVGDRVTESDRCQYPSFHCITEILQGFFGGFAVA